MAQATDPTTGRAVQQVSLSPGQVDALAQEVIEQAESLEELDWSEKDALHGALDNVLDDAGYHVPDAGDVEREPLERAIRARLPLSERETLGFSRGSCQFQAATPVGPEEA